MGAASSKIEIKDYQKKEFDILKTTYSLLKDDGSTLIGNIILSHLPSQLYELVATTISIHNIGTNLVLFLDKIKERDSKILDLVLELDFEHGIDDLDVEVDKILTDLVNQGQQLADFDYLCQILRSLLPVIAPAVGDIMAIFLEPENSDNLNSTSIVIKELIELGAHESFDLVKGFYTSLPPEVQQILQNRSSLDDFFHHSLKKIRQINMSIPNLETKESISYEELFVDQIIVNKIIEEKYRPAIQEVSEIIPKLMTLAFTILSINKFCTDECKTLGPITTVECDSNGNNNQIVDQVIFQIEDGVITVASSPDYLEGQIEIINLDRRQDENSTDPFENLDRFQIVVAVTGDAAEVIKAPSGINVVLEYY